MTRCSALYCTNNSKNSAFSFFRFPKDHDRSRAWIVACHREDLLKSLENLHSSSFRICGMHFEEKMFLNNLQNRLQNEAVPSLFSTQECEKRTTVFLRTLDISSQIELNQQKITALSTWLPPMEEDDVTIIKTEELIIKEEGPMEENDFTIPIKEECIKKEDVDTIPQENTWLPPVEEVNVTTLKTEELVIKEDDEVDPIEGDNNITFSLNQENVMEENDFTIPIKEEDADTIPIIEENDIMFLPFKEENIMEENYSTIHLKEACIKKEGTDTTPQKNISASQTQTSEYVWLNSSRIEKFRRRIKHLEIENSRLQRTLKNLEKAKESRKRGDIKKKKKKKKKK